MLTMPFKRVLSFGSVNEIMKLNHLENDVLQRLPITRDLPSSKESDKVAFWWTSIKGKPLKLF